ncbi:ATP-binding protein [Desulfosporosinus burensis]
MQTKIDEVGMRMKANSIVTKLWIVINILTLIVIGVAGILHMSIMDKIYYDVQFKQLTSLAKKVANFASTENDSQAMDLKVKLASGLIEGNIMVYDKNGIVQTFEGFAKSTKDTSLVRTDPTYSPLTKDDIKELLSGETVTHKGNNPFFNTQVLTVGVPVTDPQSSIGAVVIHVPIEPLAGQLAVFKTITIYSTVGGLALGITLSYLFSKKVSEPLRSMSRVALAMANGDFSRRITINTNDEVGLLADSLNTVSGQLKEKLAQLERLDQTRREFVSNLSHEMKTPLSIIQAFTEALQDDLAVDINEKNSYLNNIYEETARLKRLITDILDLKKMEEGYEDFKMNDVDLKLLASSVQSNFSTLVEEKGVKLTFHISRKTPLVWGDSDRIKQVFINLLDNAVRHTPKGGEIVITIAHKADNVLIEIKDSGIGIAPEDLPMIWERFYKGDKSRSRSQGGTGLGLAIVKRIIETHGGHISVWSKPGEGTIFTIILPKKMVVQ